MQCNAVEGDIKPARPDPKRVARVVAEPQLDKGWNIEYSLHTLNTVLASDARATFLHELEPLIEKEHSSLSTLPSDADPLPGILVNDGDPGPSMLEYLIDRLDQKMSKEEGTSAKDLVTTKLIGIPTWQPAPTFEGVRSGDWSSAVLDLSVYPSQEVNKVRKALYLKVCGWVQALRDNLAKKGVWLDAVCPITGHCMYGDRTSNVFNELEGLTMMLGFDSIPIGCCGIVLHPRWNRNAYPCTVFTLATKEQLLQAVAEVGSSPSMPTIIDEAAKECVDGDSCL